MPFSSSRLPALWRVLFLTLAALCWNAAATAKSLVPIESFTRFAQHSSVVASPDGKRLAAVTPAGGRRGLLVYDLETNKGNIIAHYNDMDISNVRWISNKRLLYSLIDLQSGLGEQLGTGMFAIDADGKDAKELRPVRPRDYVGIFRGYTYADDVGPESDEIYALGNHRSIYSRDLYKLNTRTGKAQLLTSDTPGNVGAWIQDDKGDVAGAMSFDDDTGKISVFRTVGGKFDKLIEFDSDERGWGPVSVNSDGTWVIMSNLDTDKVVLAKYDPAQRKVLEIMAQHPRFDLGTTQGALEGEDDADGGSVRPAALLKNKAKEVIGIRMHVDKETTLWFDKDYAKVQATMDAALPGRVNRIKKLGDTKRYLVRSYSDRQPGEYLLYSPEQKKLVGLFEARPWLKESEMSERRFITYKARDGREISAYLTLPAEAAKGPVPLIVHPHGGPHLRNEYWEFDAEAQFYASRGYAVIQPEYRGAMGFGYDHLVASYKQWGLTMQDDLTDAVKHLVATGVAKADKVCISGGSYGGYAVAMGLVKDPDLYKCGINVVGVTASQYMNEVTWTDFSQSKSAERSLLKTVGDPKTDAAILAAGNAVDQAAKIKAPMLLIYGLMDQRVPLINGERMRDALQKNGKKYEWVVYKDEGHGFLRQENRIDYYKRMEKFLAEHLAP